MFYGYPSAAADDNWLHDCLVQMVTAIHRRLDQGKGPIAWPTIIPQAHRKSLRTRVGLKNRLQRYRTAAKRLTPADRARVLTCLSQQNAIADLVSCSIDCECVADLPTAIRNP